MKKKTSTEIVKSMDEDKEKSQKLKEIRKERKELENELNENSKPQKRKVEIIEYDDGTFSLKGYAYSLPLQINEVVDAFRSWLDNSLEKGSVFEK